MPFDPFSVLVWPSFQVAALALGLGVSGGATGSAALVEGAWRPHTYVMKNGVVRKVEGLIIFSGSTWLTLFFIQSGSDLDRGASEGGTFTLDGEGRLTLRHHLHFSGGKALPNVPETAPLRMEVTPDERATVEPCRVEQVGDELTIHFPSGNRMHFSRVRAR